MRGEKRRREKRKSNKGKGDKEKKGGELNEERANEINFRQSEVNHTRHTNIHPPYNIR